MKRAIPSLALMVFLFYPPLYASPQSKDVKPGATGSISGLVSLGGKPLARITVGLFASHPSGRPNSLATVMTDNDGRFQFIAIARGSYRVIPLAPGYLTDNNPRYPWEAGKDVLLNEAESIENIDFSLKRGAVISGRVTDANHQPIIDHMIGVWRFDEKGQQYQSPFVIYDSLLCATDDRGVYRIYGLPAGRYKVSAGEVTRGSAEIASNGAYERTYYPDTTDIARAEFIDLQEGQEASGIDITLAPFIKAYAVLGRVIETATGNPVSGRHLAMTPLAEKGAPGSSTTAGWMSNPKGEFRVDGLFPGRYAIALVNSDNSEFYSEPALIEVTDTDVKEIEIKAFRGASLSGRVIIEGEADADTLAQLQRLNVYVSLPPGPVDLRLSLNPVAPDGSFRINGLRAGTAQIQIQSITGENHFIILRVEQNGVEKKSFDIKEGEQINDVRLVVAYASGSLRGQLKIENGTLPEGTTFQVEAILTDPSGRKAYWQAVVDARGVFLFDSLPTGDYKINIFPRVPAGHAPIKPLEQRLRIINGIETPYTFTFDLKDQ